MMMCSRASASLLLLGLFLGAMTVEAEEVTYATCSKDENAHWKNDACFCNDGYVSASWHGGHPCIKEELKQVYYCAIDKFAYWDPETQECFCDEGYEPWRGEQGGHPCQETDKYGIKVRKARCEEDENADWDTEVLNCFCKDGYQPSTGSESGGHPCIQAKDL
jgi:hypothetical protein